ncbi:MAG: hypothetical protein K5888_10860 [Lachnospiraceae bacterium]|nr:hypothetical protein [Lachnospiraceae bacterium]
MKIGEAKPIYYENRRELVDQIRTLYDRKTEAEKKYRLTGDSAFSEEAATLELSLDATNKAFEDNQKVLDSLVEQEVSIMNMEASKQQGEAMEKEVENLGKIMTVFRRLAKGDIVPATDEKKLMEYDDKMYQMAKNMQMMAMRLEKERKRHKSMWEDEEKAENPDPEELANNSEFAGDLPDIEIPSVPDGAGAEGAGSGGELPA